MSKREFTNTSWQRVGPWYNKIVGNKGHFYHQTVILPNVIRLLAMKNNGSLLDVGCGQGILARGVEPTIDYEGIDLAPNLIDEARKLDKNKRHQYLIADAIVERKMGPFDRIALILSLQNIAKPFLAIKNCFNWLKVGGKIVIIINHPAFRIPKHSDWKEIDGKQWRMVDGYMQPLQIPIESSPFDKKNNEVSISYHYPLSAYSEMLSDNGFVIEKIEEWISPKKSTGVKAVIEDKARREIPLFMAIVGVKR